METSIVFIYIGIMYYLIMRITPEYLAYHFPAYENDNKQNIKNIKKVSFAIPN